MLNNIEISVDNGSPIEITLNYATAPDIAMELNNTDSQVIEVSFANIGPKGEKGDSGIGTTVTFSTINELRDNVGTNGDYVAVLGYYSAIDAAGGNFFYDSASTDVDNGGTIIKPTGVSGAGRWKRILYDRTMNVRWFGAIADGATDNYSKIMAAYNAALSINIAGLPGKGTLYFPGASNYYYCSQTIEPTAISRFIGDEGSFPYQSSVIVFPARTKGLNIRLANGASRVFLKDIQFLCNSLGNREDVTYHGIDTDSVIYMDNVAIRGFQGDGLRIDTTVSGNANVSVIKDCHFYGNRCDNFHPIGNDSNAIAIFNLDSQNSGRSCIRDDSFLGNRYYAGHISYAGSHPYQDGMCSHGGKFYFARTDNVNKEPHVAGDWQTYWAEADAVETPQYVLPWDGGTNYYGCRPLWCTGAIQSGEIHGIYTEGGQNSSAWGGYNTAYGGTFGSGVDAGSRWLAGDIPGLKSNTPMVWRDLVDSDVFTGIGNTEGLYFQGNEPLNGYLQMKSIGGNWIAQYALNSTAFIGIQWPLLGISAAFQERTGNAGVGVPHFSNRGLFMFDNANGNIAKNIKLSSSVPTTGVYGAGDIVFNIGPTSKLIGWKCTSGGDFAGTPPTFETWTST